MELRHKITGFALTHYKLVAAVMVAFTVVLGAMIRDSNTVVPAHYHASIGAVTVAFMGAAYHLLKMHSRSILA